MKKFLRRAIILMVIFVLGVTGSAFLLNSETTDDRSDMNDPVLPEIMVDLGGNYANRMYGYAQPMQADFIRDSLTPLDATKKLTFVINPYDTKVNSLSYEIRTSDGSKVIENRKIKSLDKENSYLKASVEIGSDLRMNQEYSLQISLDTNKGTGYYYTRIISRSNLNADKYVKFVKSFYEKCMDKTAAEDLASYLEPETTGAATNFTDINIKSTFSEISWGNLKPQIYKSGIPVIKDINETTASLSLEYQMSAKDADGNTEIYDVTEFYRMRYTETRIMLLDFERSAQQVFEESSIHISDDGLLLGVRDKNVSYVMNDTAGVLVFVQQGDLWSYSPDDGKLAQIFSFRKQQDGDFRDSRTQHDIKIIRVDDNGDVDFVLYGYMNRGIREGYSGVCVYHYSNDQNVVEEKIFIPSTESYEFLKEDLGTLSYVSTDNQLFLLFAQKLYQINISEGTCQILEEGINREDFVVSETNAYAAWQLQEGEGAGQIREIEFETLQTRQLAAAEGQQICPLGFMNEDLIYGIIVNGDVVTDDNGHETRGIHTLRIEGFDGTAKKEYHQDGLYITNVTVGSTLVEFELSAKSGNTFVPQKKDTIMNNKKAATKQVSVELVSNSRTGTQVRLAFEDEPETDEPLVVYAKMRSMEDRQVVLDKQVSQDEIYYVYAKGGLDSTYYDPAQAVMRADEQTGVVLNGAQQYIWERGNKKTKLTLNLEDVPEIMRTGSLDKQTLQDGLGDAGTIIDLSGCTLDGVLYEISAQRPVIAKTGANSSVVIIGYDEYNTWLYDPATGETYPYGMNDSTALFEAAGNIFISYIESFNY
ncbi:hypothetical protein [Ruminococcus sp. 5_1_39BFAA]|uniref:hypothetical protein n=1 Tax=Ruminococcus sp. 5_1_39BFAA TaxID=457412 RepID=UPI003568A1F6